MAKHKRKSKKQAEPVERSPFWALATAALLCLAALFVLLGGFGTGGPLPVGLFHGGFVILGVAAYLVPLAFAYWCVVKFVREDHRLPLGNIVGMIALLVFAAAFLGAAFSGGAHDTTGGAIGTALSATALHALDRVPAALLFLVL